MGGSHLLHGSSLGISLSVAGVGQCEDLAPWNLYNFQLTVEEGRTSLLCGLGAQRLLEESGSTVPQLREELSRGPFLCH